MRKKDLIRMSLLLILIAFSLVFLELSFKSSILIINFNQEFIFLILFSLGYSLIILFFLMFFKPSTIRILVIVLISMISMLFLLQDIYHAIVSNFYSIQIAGDFSVGLSFIGDAFLALRFKHGLYFVPIIITLMINRFYPNIYKSDYRYLKQPLFVLIAAAIFINSATNQIDDTYQSGSISYIYSQKDLYDYVYDTQKTVKTFGLLTYVQRDIMNVFRTSPLRTNEYIVLLEDFISQRPRHQQNAFSNILKNKNFIMIMAESFDTYAIHEVLTPHLYQMKTEASFNNYYSPLYYRSTADTEFMSHLSLFPNKNVTLSMEAYKDNTFPNTLPRLFEQQGYKTFSYHNYIDYFYPRTYFHTNTLGFQVYKGASALGLLDEVPRGTLLFNHIWQRDSDLISLTVDEFINENKFFVNYITVSGHFNYNSDHEVVPYHIEALDAYLEETNTTLPSDIYYYLATAMELDLAIGLLKEALAEKNKLDDTIIMIYGDHYAYAIDEDVIWDYDTIKEDNDIFDLHKVPLIFHAPNTKLQGSFNRYMSSLDILPTISNLFGLNLNYQHVFGVDVFSNRDAIIKFSNLSFKSRDFFYNSLTEVYSIENDAMTLEELKFLEQQLITDYRYNTLFLEYDFLKPRDDE
jgi:lipoteichoic acid synthase